MLRSFAFRWALSILLTVLVPSCSLNAQTAKPPLKAHKTRAASTAKPKLTAQQQAGLSILAQQSGVAKGLSPITRSFALLEIARGYEKLERTKALATLRDAFHATQAIEEPADGHPSMKVSLQTQIVQQLIELDPAYCEQLVPQLSGPAKGRAIDALVGYYTGKKQFAHAISLLGQLGDQEFPYLTGQTHAGPAAGNGG